MKEEGAEDEARRIYEDTSRQTSMRSDLTADGGALVGAIRWSGTIQGLSRLRRVDAEEPQGTLQRQRCDVAAGRSEGAARGSGQGAVSRGSQLLGDAEFVPERESQPRPQSLAENGYCISGGCVELHRLAGDGARLSCQLSANVLSRLDDSGQNLDGRHAGGRLRSQHRIHSADV